MVMRTPTLDAGPDETTKPSFLSSQGSGYMTRQRKL